jgi:hypothetical protein
MKDLALFAVMCVEKPRVSEVAHRSVSWRSRAPLIRHDEVLNEGFHRSAFRREYGSREADSRLKPLLQVLAFHRAGSIGHPSGSRLRAGGAAICETAHQGG